MRRADLVACLFSVIAACSAGCDDSTSLSVTVCGDMMVPGDFDTVRISAWVGVEKEVVAGVIELLECPGSLLTQLPLTHRMGAQSGERRVVAQALKDGVEVGRVETRVQLSGDTDVVVLRLDAGCIGVSCPLGQTCLEGACRVTPFASEEPMVCGEVGERPSVGSIEDCPEGRL